MFGNSNKVKLSNSDKTIMAVIYTVLVFTFIIVLYPLIFVLSSSFSDAEAIISGEVRFLPVRPSLKGYATIFKHKAILTGYYNSLWYTTVGTTVNIIITLMAAYPLSRKDCPGKRVIMMLFTFTMIFNGGLIPTYLVTKSLHLINTRAVMFIPLAMNVYQMIIARTFFQSNIPMELSEAAEIDGSSDLQFIWKVVIPLSAPIIAVLALMYAVQHWNSYFHAMIYLKSEALYPLQIILRDILIQNQFDATMVGDIQEMIARKNLQYLLKYSLIVVACVPVLALYPLIQRYFVKGIMIGSVKG